jgi:hypothetical protein
MGISFDDADDTENEEDVLYDEAVVKATSLAAGLFGVDEVPDKHPYLVFTGGSGNTDEPELHMKFMSPGGKMLGQGWFKINDLLDAIGEKF